MVRSLGFALLVVGMLGCNEIAGIKDPVGREPGTSGGPVATGIDRFYGTWSTADGVLTLKNCQSAKTLTMLTGQVLLAKSPSAGLLFIIDGCQLGTTVTGDVASFDAAQRCVARGDTSTSTATVTINYRESTFALVAGSSTQATESLTARIEFSDADTGAVVDACDYEETATFTKL